MNQIKIGKFIAEKRKERGYTQAQLAEKLGITDRAVSKWENGKSLPDSGIMLELCKALEISVTELLSGEEITVEKYDENIQNAMLELVKQKEQADREMLRLEYVIGFSASITYFILIFVAAYIDMQNWVRYVLITAGFIIFLFGMFFALRIEQKAGYYECQRCHHKYVPKYSSVFFAMHVNRTRYMKCPECGKRSWQKNVISKD